MSKANYFQRPEPRNGLKEWQKEEGSLVVDFPPMRHKTIHQKTYNRSGLPYVTTCAIDEDPGKDETQRININLSALSDYQNDNLDVPILVDAKGKVAEVGADCRLNEEILLGRGNGQFRVQ